MINLIESNGIDIDRIISEELDKFVFEAEHLMRTRDDFEKRFEKAHKRDGRDMNSADSSDVRDFLDSPYIVAGAVVQKATGVSPEGAASMASKIIKGERKVSANLANTVRSIQNKLSQ